MVQVVQVHNTIRDKSHTLQWMIMQYKSLLDTTMIVCTHSLSLSYKHAGIVTYTSSFARFQLLPSLIPRPLPRFYLAAVRPGDEASYCPLSSLHEQSDAGQLHKGAGLANLYKLVQN